MFKFLNGEVGGVTVFCARVAACTNERALNTAKGKQSIWLHQKCLQPGAPKNAVLGTCVLKTWTDWTIM